MIETVAKKNLVGKPVAGIRALVSRGVPEANLPPMWRTLRSVELRHERGEEWIYVTWEPDSAGGRYDCGFGGVAGSLIEEFPATFGTLEIERPEVR